MGPGKEAEQQDVSVTVSILAYFRVHTPRGTDGMYSNPADLVLITPNLPYEARRRDAQSGVHWQWCSHLLGAQQCVEQVEGNHGHHHPGGPGGPGGPALAEPPGPLVRCPDEN